MSSTSYRAARDTFAHRLDEWNWTGQRTSRRHILEAFLELAIANGFDSISMRTIANAVNIKPPSLYSHFPGGKDEIVAESLRWQFHRFGLALLDAVDGAESAGEFWDALVRLHFTRQVRLPESNLWDLLVATDRMATILPTDVRAQVGDWVSLHEQMYAAAAREMGYPQPEERVRIGVTILAGATRWAPGLYDDVELDSLNSRDRCNTRGLAGY